MILWKFLSHMKPQLRVDKLQAYEVITKCLSFIHGNAVAISEICLCNTTASRPAVSC